MSTADKYQITAESALIRRSWFKNLLRLPEFNLFLFSFLLNFVYEVWQAPFYDFYGAPTLAEKIWALTHCTFGDGVITLVVSLIVSLAMRSRQWIVSLDRKPVLLFIGLGWVYTLFSEIYRTRIAYLYGIQGFAIPGLEISSLPLVQWLILPPLVLWLSRYQILGHRFAERSKREL